MREPTSTSTPRAASGSPLTLKTLLDRPKHRWMVPAGFLFILGACTLIGLIAVQGISNQQPNPQPSQPNL